MEESETSFDDFSIEMGEYEIVQTSKFDRYVRIGTGGSIASEPLVLNRIVYFCSMNHSLYALDLATGEEIWRFKANDRMGACSPVHKDGILIAGSHDHTLYALDHSDGRLLWKFRTDGPLCTKALIVGETVYFGSFDQNIYALDLRSGSLKWKFRTSAEISSVPAFYEGSLFVGSYDHNVYRLDAETGQMISKFRTEGEIHNLNAFSMRDGIIYVPSFDNNVRAIRIDDGFEVWRKRVSSYGISSAPVLVGDKLYQGTRDGDVVCMNLSGDILWKFRTRELVHIPVIVDGLVYFGSSDNNFYCIDGDGKRVWKFPTQGRNVTAPDISGGRICFGSWDCNLYCLDMEGNLIWKFRSEGQPSYIPPPYESFEVRLKVSETELEESPLKRYDFGERESSVEEGSFYKSRITYQVKTQYTEKGKYQVDSDEEAL
jgi:outer membrane protein assembly factor BamB